MTQRSEQTRDYLFDNIKAVMLFLVVIGHILDPFIVSEHSLYRYLMQYIYLFHMPMFAFVTGYFSKNIEKSRETAVKKVLVPYVFWQILYIATALFFMKMGLANYNTDVFKPSILLPTSPLYYLLCVFIWKVFIKDIQSLRHPICFSALAGLAVSLVFDRAFHIGWGACFSLLIFFVLGSYCTPEHVARIRAVPKVISCLIMAAAVIPAVILPYNFRNVRFTYADVGLEPLMGILYRILFYCIAVLMIAALINLFSTKKTCFSRVGKHALLVYAGSSFAAPALYLVLAGFIPVTVSIWTNLLGMCIFAFLLVLFCSMDFITNIYDFIIGQINRLIFK
ncbi:MAG: hypothetical protein RSC13_06905 [Clostridium sp.]